MIVGSPQAGWLPIGLSGIASVSSGLRTGVILVSSMIDAAQGLTDMARPEGEKASGSTARGDGGDGGGGFTHGEGLAAWVTSAADDAARGALLDVTL